MQNLNQFIVLKMGNKIVFKDPIQKIKANTNKNFQGNTNFKNYGFQNNFYSPNSNINRKKSYERMDIIPKCIANENLKEVNRELLNRLSKKKNIFNKIMKAYFSDNDDYFSNSIQEVEMEMNRNKDLSENNKNKDFEGFMDLLSFINCNRTNNDLSAMQNMSLSDYSNMNYDTKKIVLGGIFENKVLFAQKLNLKKYERINNNPKRPNSITNKNLINMNKNRFSNPSLITKEQIDLFKTFIGNPHINDSHVISYFDPSNPKVMLAANRYFCNIYGVDYLTLHYYYPSKPQSGTKIHKFRFVGEIGDLFTAAQDDFISVVNPRLFLGNGREIKNDRKIKCIGALNLSNNSKIKVLF